jgi:hypothetical protein
MAEQHPYVIRILTVVMDLSQEAGVDFHAVPDKAETGRGPAEWALVQPGFLAHLNDHQGDIDLIGKKAALLPSTGCLAEESVEISPPPHSGRHEGIRQSLGLA